MFRHVETVQRSKDMENFLSWIPTVAFVLRRLPMSGNSIRIHSICVKVLIRKKYT